VTDQLEWDHLVRMGHNLVGEGFAMQLPSVNHGDVAMWFQGFSGFD